MSFSTPALPPGAMNAQLSSLPRVYATATDNAYTAEQRAIRDAALSERDRMYAQRRALEAEQAARQFNFSQRLQGLLKGGATVEEATRYALPELADASQISLALSRLPRVGNNPASISSVPIKDPTTGKVIGQSVYDQGRLHATRFTNPEALTPDETAQRQILKGAIDSDRAQLSRLERMKGNIEQRALNPSLDSDIKAITDRLNANISAFTNRSGTTSATAPKSIDRAKADEIKAAFRAGTISRDDAIAQLKQIGFE